MRALWSDRPNCSHNVSQKVKRISRFSDFLRFSEVFRGFQRFLEVFRQFQRPSQSPSQSVIFLSELRVLLLLIVLSLKTPARCARSPALLHNTQETMCEPECRRQHHSSLATPRHFLTNRATLAPGLHNAFRR